MALRDYFSRAALNSGGRSKVDWNTFRGGTMVGANDPRGQRILQAAQMPAPTFQDFMRNYGESGDGGPLGSQRRAEREFQTRLKGWQDLQERAQILRQGGQVSWGESNPGGLAGVMSNVSDYITPLTVMAAPFAVAGGMAALGAEGAAGAGAAGAGTAAGGAAPLASEFSLAGGGAAGSPGLAGGTSGLGLAAAAPYTGMVETGLGAGAGLAGGATGLGVAGNAAAGGATLPAAGAAGSSALSRLLGLGQQGQDVLSVLGQAAPGVLGYLGAGQQSDAYRDVANQYLGIGAPYRGTLAASYQPGFDLSAQPGYGDAFNRMADISARQYGARYGNPAGSPTAQGGILSDVWNQSYLPALASYRGQLGQFGGLGLNTAGAGSLGGAGVAGGGLDAIGLGLSRLMTPKSPYEEWFNQMTQQQSPSYRTVT